MPVVRSRSPVAARVPPSGTTAAPPTTAPVTSAVAHTFIASAPPPTPTSSAIRAATGSAESALPRRA